MLNRALEFFLTIFATISLAYISIATPVGPWISPCLIWLAYWTLIRYQTLQPTSQQEARTQLALLQVKGALGGLVATALGFLLPTLYFLDANKFNQWLAQPWYFCLTLSGWTLFAGWWGTWLGHQLYPSFASNSVYSFPVSQMLHDTIKQVVDELDYWLWCGLGCTWALLLTKSSLSYCLQTNHQLIAWLGGGVVAGYIIRMIFPTMVAAGFMAGPKMMNSLICGLIIKQSLTLINYNFPSITATSSNPTWDLCAGMLAWELLTSITGRLQSLSQYCLNIPWQEWKKSIHLSFTQGHYWLLLPALILSSLVGWIVAGLSIPVTLCMIIAAGLVGIELGKFAVQVGLVPFGRFVTFAMLPFLPFLYFHPKAMLLICCFIGVFGAALANLLIQYKLANLQGIDTQKIWDRQWWGMIEVSIIAAISFWVLFQAFQLGSNQFFGQRGQLRALMFQMPTLSLPLVAIGVFTAWILQWRNIGTTMLLSSLLMNLELTTCLILGSLGAKLFGKNPNARNLITGIFTGESLFMIGSLLLKLLSNRM